jgi:ribosome-binding protein aMBF1 (putative translation factor)
MSSGRLSRIVKSNFSGRRAPFRAVRDVEFIELMCDRFMAACEASGLSKQDFARTVGLTAQQLSNISVYRNPPSHKALAEAARAFGLTTDFFYSGNLGGMRDQTMADKLREILTSRLG